MEIFSVKAKTDAGGCTESVKRIMQVVIVAILLTGGTGCMSDHQEKTTQAMLEYLENKYGETFIPERYEKGSGPLAEIKHGVSMMVHPEKNREIPFYVDELIGSEGYDDNYLLANFSYEYTEKYKYEIDSLDDREKIVKFGFGFADHPEDPKMLQVPVDDFVNNYNGHGRINLYIAVKQTRQLDKEEEAKYLYDLYKYMNNKTNRNFTVSVAYLNERQFEADETSNLMRIAHTINFNWFGIDANGEKTIRIVDFERRNNIQEPSYFNEFFNYKEVK